MFKAVALSLALLCGSGTALAGITAQEAAKLGAELTPLGAEKAGNADGTIPAWTGGIKSPAEAGVPNYKTGEHHPDPFANDKPLFTITAANMGQYAAKLTEGHKKLASAVQGHVQDPRLSDPTKCGVPSAHLRRHPACRDDSESRPGR